MARYIDAEKAVEDARLTHCKDCYSCHGIICRSCIFDDTITFIEDYPTADVVPKAELERLEKEVDRLSQVVMYHDAFKADEIQDAKAAVTRKILSDIKKQVHNKAVHAASKDEYAYINIKVFDAILRNYLNKYTEELP